MAAERANSTQKPRSRATSTDARISVVLPMPASPSTNSAAGSTAHDSRNPLTNAVSAERPVNSDAMRRPHRFLWAPHPTAWPRARLFTVMPAIRFFGTAGLSVAERRMDTVAVESEDTQEPDADHGEWVEVRARIGISTPWGRQVGRRLRREGSPLVLGQSPGGFSLPPDM